MLIFTRHLPGKIPIPSVTLNGWSFVIGGFLGWSFVIGGTRVLGFLGWSFVIGGFLQGESSVGGVAGGRCSLAPRPSSYFSFGWPGTRSFGT